jgi:hypothetical protein
VETARPRVRSGSGHQSQDLQSVFIEWFAAARAHAHSTGSSTCARTTQPVSLADWRGAEGQVRSKIVVRRVVQSSPFPRNDHRSSGSTRARYAGHLDTALTSFTEKT